jgi:predicted polyphosphate/ATP-dependent NAD kinase
LGGKGFERGRDLSAAGTVRHEEVNAMLLNEFLKEHAKVEQGETKLTEQANKVHELKAATVAELKLALKEQAEQVKKVNAQLVTIEEPFRPVTGG